MTKTSLEQKQLTPARVNSFISPKVSLVFCKLGLGNLSIIKSSEATSSWIAWLLLFCPWFRPSSFTCHDLIWELINFVGLTDAFRNCFGRLRCRSRNWPPFVEHPLMIAMRPSRAIRQSTEMGRPYRIHQQDLLVNPSMTTSCCLWKLLQDMSGHYEWNLSCPRPLDRKSKKWQLSDFSRCKYASFVENPNTLVDPYIRMLDAYSSKSGIPQWADQNQLST